MLDGRKFCFACFDTIGQLLEVIVKEIKHTK
jgi:hypothetical protein